jgi:hypothetical protein
MFEGVQGPCDFDEVAWVMFVVGEWPWELIICSLNVLKCNFGDVDEAVFHDH